MRKRLVALLLTATGFLAVAIGPGISLVRCELTGEVQLSCCCAERDDVAASREQLEATDDCCQFAHLDASWQRSALSSRADLPAPSPIHLSSGWHVACQWPVGEDLPTQVSTVAASPPPLWLSTKSLRV